MKGISTPVSNLSRFARRGQAVVAASALALASAASAADKSWATNNGAFHSAVNWTPIGVPTVADNVFIGNHAAAVNGEVAASSPVRAANLLITDGMRLISNHASVRVDGTLLISGMNDVETGAVRSRLVLDSVDGASLTVPNAQVVDSGYLQMRNGSYANITNLLQVGSLSLVGGDGVLTLLGNGAKSMINDGVIIAYPDGTTIRQAGNGLIDLDGNGGDGVLNLDSYNFLTLQVSRLTIEGTALHDDYDGYVSLLMGGVLDMDIDSGWAVGSGGQIHVHTFEDLPMPTPAIIRGAPLTLGGLLTVIGPEPCTLRIESALVAPSGGRVALHENSRLEVTGSTSVQGGEFSLADGAKARLTGATSIADGLFRPWGMAPSTGDVEFAGPTTWRGAATFEVDAFQFATATVAAPSVIDAGTLDMDGTGGTTWNVNSSLVINAQTIDAAAGNTFDGTINVASGFIGVLTLNLADPTEAWTMNGQLNLAGSPFFITRIAGSDMNVAGEVNVAAQRSQIAADTRLTDAAVLNFAAASSTLRFTGESIVSAATTFTGTGMLQNGPTGRMRLDDGANLDEVGLTNDGRLEIGNGPGVASVDRFAQTASGAWHVEVGGPAAGTQHDQLLVSGGTAQLAGTLDVELINLSGSIFTPAIGDEFTVLVALDGISSVFANSPTSHAYGYTYAWDVVYDEHEVTLRLAAITPTIGDMNCDGLVNFDDIDPFILALLGEATYDASYPECRWQNADTNGDGSANFDDMDGFLVLLIG